MLGEGIQAAERLQSPAMRIQIMALQARQVSVGLDRTCDWLSVVLHGWVSYTYYKTVVTLK